MCTGIEIAMLIGTAASVAGTVVAGQNQQKQADAQAQQAVNTGAYEADSYKAQADKIRRAGKAQVGAADASLAASGVKLGTGTPLELKKTITQRYEEDALTSLMNGGRSTSAATEQAGIYSKAGSAAITNSYFKAGSTVLGAAGDYSRGGWKAAA
jgi:hypothetical protein